MDFIETQNFVSVQIVVSWRAATVIIVVLWRAATILMNVFIIVETLRATSNANLVFVNIKK